MKTLEQIQFSALGNVDSSAAPVGPKQYDFFRSQMRVLKGDKSAIVSEEEPSDVVGKSVKQFALDNGWKYTTSSIVPWTLDYFAPRTCWSIVEGELEGANIKICATLSATNNVLEPLYFIELSLQRRYPHLLLDSQHNEGRFYSSIDKVLDKSQQIDLEANYKEEFILYAPTGYQVDALSLIDPSIMQSLLSLKHRFDVDVYDSRLRLSTMDPIFNEEAMREALEAILLIYRHFKRTDKFWTPSIAQTEPPRLKMPNTSGDVMKVGGKRIYMVWPFAINLLVCTILIFTVFKPGDDTSTIRDDLPALAVFSIFVLELIYIVYSRNKKKPYIKITACLRCWRLFCSYVSVGCPILR